MKHDHLPTGEPPIAVRVGSGAIGMIIGLALGAVLGIASIGTGLLLNISMAKWVFGTAGVLLVLCLAVPSVGLALLPGSIHFLHGASEGFNIDSDGEPDKPSQEASGWLTYAFYAGVVVGVCACLYSALT